MPTTSANIGATYSKMLQTTLQITSRVLLLGPPVWGRVVRRTKTGFILSDWCRFCQTLFCVSKKRFCLYLSLVLGVRQWIWSILEPRMVRRWNSGSCPLQVNGTMMISFELTFNSFLLDQHSTSLRAITLSSTIATANMEKQHYLVIRYKKFGGEWDALKAKLIDAVREQIRPIKALNTFESKKSNKWVTRRRSSSFSQGQNSFAYR